MFVNKKIPQTLIAQHLQGFSVIICSFLKAYLAPSEGIEPPAEEPESSVLSITPRGHAINNT